MGIHVDAKNAMVELQLYKHQPYPPSPRRKTATKTSDSLSRADERNHPAHTCWAVMAVYTNSENPLATARRCPPWEYATARQFFWGISLSTLSPSISKL